MNWIMGIFIPLNFLMAVLSHNWQAAALAVCAGASYVGWMIEKGKNAGLAFESYSEGYEDGFDDGFNK